MALVKGPGGEVSEISRPSLISDASGEDQMLYGVIANDLEAFKRALGPGDDELDDPMRVWGPDDVV